MVRLRYGNQKPTFESIGKYAYTDGDDAIDLFRQYGATFYPSQEYEFSLMLARDKNDEPATLSLAISKPRQNGKSYAARWYAIWAAVIEGKKVLYTAHHGATVRKMFKEMLQIIKNNKDLRKELVPGKKGIYSAAGLEGFYFSNGGCIEFATRTASGGRGGTYDVIIIDEAQEYNEAQQEALKPSTIASESGEPQMIYLGTPPGPDCHGTIFKGFHDKAHAGHKGVWWLEWSVESVPDLNDTETMLELAYATNPAMGYRIRERVMLDAILSATDPAGFAREYLGYWSKLAAIVTALNLERWKACATADPPEDGIVSFGVKFSLDGKSASLAACLKPAEGLAHIEVVKLRSTARGVTWIVNSLKSRQDEIAQVMIDGQVKAELLERRLREAGFKQKQIKICSAKELTSACSLLEDSVSEGTVTHYNQVGLNKSVEMSSKRIVGKSGGWAFDGTNPIPIESCAIALYGATTTKRKPKKKRRLL